MPPKSHPASGARPKPNARSRAEKPQENVVTGHAMKTRSQTKREETSLTSSFKGRRDHQRKAKKPKTSDNGPTIPENLQTKNEGLVSEHEERPAKRRRADGWQPYTAADGQTLYLPPEMINMLNDDSSFAPEPRSSFKEILQVKPGDVITLPSLGQEPKHYDSGYQGKRFVVTEQMVEVWQLLAADSKHSIKRILSGPRGIGKSYLALFLAVMAYANAWPLLYISDAAALDQPTGSKSSEEICKRFLALNKDILTAVELQRLVKYTDTNPVVDACAGEIMSGLLKQRDHKTLLVVDEHGALFNVEPPAPDRLPILGPLKNLTAWDEAMNGTRVVLTGTAHANFEWKHLRRDMDGWLIFVGPLTQAIFDKLLQLHEELRDPNNASRVKEITNCVPRELVLLIDHLFGSGNLISESFEEELQNFRRKRHEEFLKKAKNYYQTLDGHNKDFYRRALSNMFLRSSLGKQPADFDGRFMDTGMVYRFIGDHNGVLKKPLCPPALDALLDVYKTCELPRSVKVASLEGILPGDDFEDILFLGLLKHSNIIFKATNLAGRPTNPVHIEFEHLICLEQNQFTPKRQHAKSLVRGYWKYPRFDFILGRMFIQVSVSTFSDHNSHAANIKKAFHRPMPNAPYFDGERNQIEIYLDEVFGGHHKADINTTTGGFTVTRNGKMVPDFRIVFIQGSGGIPNDTSLVKELRDVAHVGYDEIKAKLFGDMM
ncbi:hypothetical protein BC936DRAFT_145170 [Jimgerdemannia flammicorona]|uniref:Uncharacterized protein n=1 Tax=Jimgerdemannia flammicorona TaxID=994334 RepID=A0A433DAS5_9FUNG|nr:hypothetical protein BC936DRAFT_145170 [Jimgerdemannia flammicorona]